VVMFNLQSRKSRAKCSPLYKGQKHMAFLKDVANKQPAQAKHLPPVYWYSLAMETGSSLANAAEPYWWNFIAMQELSA